MKKKRKCCICGKEFKPGDWGNNPEPIKPYSSGTCCDECNHKKVIPARLARTARTDKGIGVGCNYAIQARGNK